MARITLCFLLLAALAAPAAAQTGRVYGVLVDPTGGVLPGVEVRAVLKDRNGETTRSRPTDASGSFNLDGLVPGAWTVTASLPGFATSSRQVTIEGGDSVEWRETMRVGSLQETITIASGSPGGRSESPRPAAAQAPATAPSAPSRPAAVSATGTPIRVGGNIKPPRKIVNVNPMYPPDADAQGISGVVILQATIDPSGIVTDVKTLRSPNDSLTRSATDAIGGWEFTPTLLNGQPVPVVMTATFNFTRQ
jgi:TonB family protein